MAKLPIAIVLPHAGLQIPAELADRLAAINRFEFDLRALGLFSLCAGDFGCEPVGGPGGEPAWGWYC